MRIVIIGFGAAGATAADLVRRQDAAAEITVLNGEACPFYLRLDLEGVFLGKPLEQLMPRPAEYWRERQIRVIGERAVRLDVTKRQVLIAPGTTLSYDRLLIATGSTPRRLAVPGDDLAGVVHYHTLRDAQRILEFAPQVEQAVIIGGGILGLELARVGMHFGWKIKLLVRGGHVGSPIVDPNGSTQILESLKRAGVEVLFHEEAAAFEGRDGNLTAVLTRSGRTLTAQLAAVCAGVLPDVAFLAGTPVLTDGQLVVNRRMQTPVPDVYAAGDAAVVHTPDGRRVSCHTWNVAASQARTAAAGLCGAPEDWKDDILYNLDFLFDQEFAMIGRWEDRHQPGCEIHELHSPQAYRALVTRGGVLEGALLLGDRTGDRRVRKLIAARARVAGRLDQIFDPSVAPEEFTS